MIRILLLSLLLIAPAMASDAPTMDGFEDPVLLERYQRLTEELRCVQCQNQNIAESNAGIAADLRDQVREKLIAGWSDEQILTFLTDRYGDFVRYRPAVNERTWLLWVGPLLFLFGGLVLLVPVLRRRAGMLADENDHRGGVE